MATIKDIAKLSKTSHGTVSNVLNNRGNVSSEKIKRVLDAAKALNYIPNINAKNLRKGYADQMVLILPNLEAQGFRDIYKSFSINAAKHNYKINLLISDNDVDNECQALTQLTAEINSGMKVAIVTCVPYGQRHQTMNEALLDHVIFLLNDYVDSKHFISYDYVAIFTELFHIMTTKNHTKLCIIKNKVDKSEELLALQTLITLSKHHHREPTIINVDPFRPHISFLESITHQDFDAFIVLSHDLTHTVKEVITNFTYQSHSSIYSIAPFTVFKESSTINYEIDFSNLGKLTFDMMKADALSLENKKLSGVGVRDWLPNVEKRKKPLFLKLLSVDNPSAQVLKSLAIQYSLLTNISVQVDILDYDAVYNLLLSGEAKETYDLIRCDLNWMSWFAHSIYQPLNQDDPIIHDLCNHIVDEVQAYFLDDGKNIYALPFSPSSQVLFYRKDLFERSDLKRLYYETHKEMLKVPTTFEELDKIAAFFTKSITKTSPTDYGLTLTTGNSGVRGSELLCRYYALSDTLINQKSEMVIDKESLMKALGSLRKGLEVSNPDHPKWWTDTAREFASGNTALSIMYSNYASELLSINSKVVGKIGEALVPGHNPLLGGGAIGISQKTHYEKEALDFMMWISKETISSQASLLGNLPSNIITYNSQDIMDDFPWFETTLESIKQSKCTRTHLSKTRRFNEKRFLEIVGDQQILDKLHQGIHLSVIADDIIEQLLDKNQTYVLNLTDS